MDASNVFLAFAKFMIIVICIITVTIIAYFSFSYIRRVFILVMAELSVYKKRIATIITIRSLRRNSNMSSVELLFEMFVSFYERQMQDMDVWELPIEVFPKGKAELSHLYKWIKKIRGENYKELSHITFNEKTGTIRYWKASYKTFKHKFVDSELKIEPSDDCDYSNYLLAFRRRYMSVENDLFDLDTEKATWIIERRRFFNF